MKTIIFFLFSFITYVFSGIVGPLGFAVMMPPYQLPSVDLRLKNDLISEFYTLEEVFLFLTKGYTDECSRYLFNICEELKKVFGTLSTLGSSVQIICENQRDMCQRLTKIKEQLCKIDEVNSTKLEEIRPLNSTRCHELYTKCRLRSLACSYEYMEQCRKLLSTCHTRYDLYDLYTIILHFCGYDFSSEKFQEELKDVCLDLFATSDSFVQLCLNPESLISHLKAFISLQRQRKGTFYLYSQLSTAALLKVQRLDGGLFSPRTDPNIDPTYFMGYLVGQSGFTSFMQTCMNIGDKCLGLGFFPQSAHFCNIKTTNYWSTDCDKVEASLLEHKIPTLIEELQKNILNEKYTEGIFWTGIDVDLCRKYLSPCSYLEKLDSRLPRLCDFLKFHCDYALEIGSSLSMFEYYVREQDTEKDFNAKEEKCEQYLPQICRTILNTTVDFLAFCLRPAHTCYALRELTRFRCEGFKKKFDAPDLTERYCVVVLSDYESYIHRCSQPDDFFDFFTKCYKKFPQNEYLKKLIHTTLKGWLGLLEEPEGSNEDDF